MQRFSSEEKIYIWLDSFPLEEQDKHKLLQAAKTPKHLLANLDELFHAVIKSDKERVYNNMARSLTDDGAYFQTVLSSLEQEGVTPLPLPSADYPEAVKQLPSPPLVLYAKGNLSLLKTNAFCIVGSRLTPETAMRTSKTIAKELSEHFTILTGTADGGDTSAIEGALAGSGKVVCLAAGGMHALPKNNAQTLAKVQKTGLILAAHSADTAVRNFSFESRNELLAALGIGTLVVSAGEKSGALITAKYAKKFHKPLFALPYPPNSAAGTGCNALIKQGARLTENADDVLEAFGIKRERTEKAAIPLTDEEERIYEILRTEHEINLSLLAEKTGIPAYLLAGSIASLEVKGLIQRTGGNRVAVI